MARRGLWVGVKASIPTIPGMSYLVRAINRLKEIEGDREDLKEIREDIEAGLSELQKVYLRDED